MMTREHLTDDIRNVIGMIEEADRGARSPELLRRSLHGLYHHFQGEPDVPPGVERCLSDAVAALEEADGSVDAGKLREAKQCLESALDFARRAGSSND
jgi:hypothetical protein